MVLLGMTKSEERLRKAYPSEEKLEQLLAQMAEGCFEALEELYLHTKTAVYGFALSILKHPQNAEDVMQETYLRLYQAAASYRPQGKPMAWILTVVRNLSLKKIQEQPRDVLPIDEDWQIADSADFTSESAERTLLQGALEHLSEEERQIVLLHSLTGLKHREIAELLHLPLSTVLSKHHRALSKLKKIMKEEK